MNIEREKVLQRKTLSNNRKGQKTDRRKEDFEIRTSEDNMGLGKVPSYK
jgi:hypothetical protein